MSPKPTYEEVEQRVEQLKKDLTRKGKELEDLRRFVDRSQDVIYRYNIDANLFILYNKAGYELYGAKDGTGLTVKTVLLSIHPEDRDKVKKAAKDSLSPNRSKGEVEYRQQHLDGSIRWMHDKWLVMRGESGKPLFIEGIVRDNTERRQVEEELRKSEQEFRVVAENVPALFSYVDANGYYRFVNNRYEKWFGISRKHIVGKHIREVLGEDTYELIKARIETVLSGNRVKYEDVLPYKRGGKRYVTVDYVPDIDERGEVRGFYALVTDISERKLTEQALQKSEERYRSLVESTEDSIYLVDRNCNYLFMNKKHLSSFGLSMNEILGRNYSDFHSEEATKDFIGKIERAIASGESISYEYKSERDGRDFILTMSPVRETAGNINAVTVISKDITERRQAEEALRRSNEKLLKEHNQRKILSNKLIELLEKDRHEIAMELHDHIGQTLTSLKMNLEIIREQIKPTDTELESQISDAEKKAIQALKDIRSVSHGLRPPVIDTLGLVSSLRQLFNETQQHTDFEIHFFNRGIPKLLERGKELTIYRIMQEALSNIIKHAQAKNVYVSLIKKEQRLLLNVEDNGVGFDLEKAMKATKRKGPLGLLIMRERAEQSDGEFVVESQVGKGTQLLVEIPI